MRCDLDTGLAEVDADNLAHWSDCCCRESFEGFDRDIITTPSSVQDHVTKLLETDTTLLVVLLGTLNNHLKQSEGEAPFLGRYGELRTAMT